MLLRRTFQMGNNVLQKKKNEKSFEELGGIFSNVEIFKLTSIERQAVKIVSKMYADVRDVSEGSSKQTY